MLARIYRPSKTAMQSGQASARDWVLEFEPGAAPAPYALMGWTAASDMYGQIRLSFASMEQALAFARAHNIPHQLEEPQDRKPVIKAYGDNFAFGRREPWSH